MYISFVTKATLWDRGVCHHNAHDHQVHHPPSVCPRFLSHMKAQPEDFHHPFFLTNKYQEGVLSQWKVERFDLPSATDSQFLEGHLDTGGGLHGAPSFDIRNKRRYAAVLPRLQIPPTPLASPNSFGAAPIQHNSPHLNPEGQGNDWTIIPTPKTYPLSPVPPRVSSRPEEKVVLESKTVFRSVREEPDRDVNPRPATSSRSPSPTSLSLGSPSHLSRTSSSLFSWSTDLTSGRSSILSDRTAADTLDSYPERSISFLQLELSPVMQPPLVSFIPKKSAQGPNTKNTTCKSSSSPTEQLSDEFQQNCSPYPEAEAKSISDKPESSKRRTKNIENVSLDTSTERVSGLTLSADKEMNHFGFSSGSPLRTIRSGSRAKLTPSSPPPRLDSHRWPVLPPISPSRVFSAASGCSQISCSQSQMFDELDGITPPSASCLSLDRPSDSSDSPRSPLRELSPGLAALTVGCDSGNLGSFSRVQLLLLDRPAPETSLEQDFSPVQEWINLMSPYNQLNRISPGHSRPLTPGSYSERCDSAGKLQQNNSNWSDRESGSPSSLKTDPSPSFEKLSSSDSSLQSCFNDENPARKESPHPERIGDDLCLDGERDEESDPAMEERKTKALNMLSKLQDDTSSKNKSSRSRSNFEDFDFLAKYCIFSPEKLAEYKRAFEAEDSDEDGYISCLQVLLALKNIIPPEMLSEREEIYVYRILEMVDFRVTDGLVDPRLFAVIASLAQKIASMDEFMRSLISNMDLRSLEVRLFKAKQLFLFLLEEQRDVSGARRGFISGEQLLLELKAGGIQLEQEAAIRLELQRIPPLDLLDFLAYLPLFMLIHKSVISNPLDDSSHL